MRFELNAKVTVSAYTVVEADSLEEAIEIAKSRDVAIGGHGVGDYDSWIIDDGDGVPFDIGT